MEIIKFVAHSILFGFFAPSMAGGARNLGFILPLVHHPR